MTGQYLQSAGKWTKERVDALSFESSTQAVYLVLKERLRNVELVLASEDIPYDIRLPVAVPRVCAP
jgi:hypothetical protein